MMFEVSPAGLFIPHASKTHFRLKTGRSCSFAQKAEHDRFTSHAGSFRAGVVERKARSQVNGPPAT